MSISLDQFISRTAESGLYTEAELREFLSRIPEAKRPQESEQFARELVRLKKLTPYQAQQVYSGKGKSLVLGNYVVLDKLGQGGMGMVLKAEHRRMERIVALKVLSPAVTKTPEVLRRFQQEVKAAAKLSHPNIATAHDADVSGNTHFLVMEFVEGSDLASVLSKTGRLSVAAAVDYVRQAARGLSYAHQKGIVHRDIKPANLLLNSEGTVKILDMGLARIENSLADGLTQSGEVMGTVDYMAPEQAIDTRKADTRADIYSLGCTLFRLLTAENVFEGETMVQKLMAHQQKPIPSLLSRRADVPLALATIFERMVAKQPQDRFQTMAEVESALAAIADAASGSIGTSSSAHTNNGLNEIGRAMADIAVTNRGQHRSTKREPIATTAEVVPEGGTIALAGKSSNRTSIADDAPAEERMIETISQSHVAIVTDTIRSRQISLELPPRRKTRKQPPKLPLRSIVIAAGFGAFFLGVLGVWVIVKDKDGKEISRHQVPEGGSAALVNDPPPPPMAKPSVPDQGNKPASPPASTPTVPIAPSAPPGPISETATSLGKPNYALEREVAEWVIKTGGNVTVIDAINVHGRKTVSALNDLPSENFTVHAIAIDTCNDFSLAHAERICKLSELNAFSARKSRIGAEQFAALKSCPCLTSLTIDDSADATALHGILKLQQLRYLTFIGAPVTDSLLARLSELPHLLGLRLYDSQRFTDKGIRDLAERGPRHLYELDLAGSRLGSPGFAALASLPRLSELNLGKTNVDDSTLAELARCPLLTIVRLEDTKVTSAGTQKLQQAIGCHFLGLAPHQFPALYRTDEYRNAARQLLERGFEIRASAGSEWYSKDRPWPEAEAVTVQLVHHPYDDSFKVSDNDLKAISRLSDIQSLRFGTRDGITGALTSLTNLGDLLFTYQTESQFKDLKQFKKLRSLSADVRDDETLKHILNLPSLQFLRFGQPSSSSFQLLQAATQIKDLNIDATNFENEVQALASARPDMLVWNNFRRVLPRREAAVSTSQPKSGKP